MSEQEKNPSPLGRLLPGSRAKTPKKVADEIFKSGTLFSLRQRRIDEDGIVPWSILRYQRVVEPSEISVPLIPYSFVTPSVFEKHLRYIKANYQPMPLGDLVARVYHNEAIPERAVALTFDYGHADFFLNALALLLKYEIPATVCLTTGYIETKTFLPIDRIAIGLTALRTLKIPVPRFKFFSDEFYQRLDTLSDKDGLTARGLLAFLDAYRKLSEVDRAALLHAFGQALGEQVILPDYDDFLSWEDVKILSDRGVTFASMGHAGLVSTLCRPEIFYGDILHSLERMVHYDIPREKYFSFPEGAFSRLAFEQLLKLKLRVGLSIGDMPHVQTQTEGVKVLGRITMSQELAADEGVFACRLARVVKDGIEF